MLQIYTKFTLQHDAIPFQVINQRWLWFTRSLEAAKIGTKLRSTLFVSPASMLLNWQGVTAAGGEQFSNTINLLYMLLSFVFSQKGEGMQICWHDESCLPFDFLSSIQEGKALVASMAYGFFLQICFGNNLWNMQNAKKSTLMRNMYIRVAQYDRIILR